MAPIADGVGAAVDADVDVGDVDADADVDADVGEALARAALALARRFASGATMWCIAPHHPEHGRHVAVEFVHPVIVGKRALPAVSIDAADPVRALRPLVRAGDVVLVVDHDGDRAIAEVMRRAAVWGATTIRIAAGVAPAAMFGEPGGRADHVIDVGDDPAAVHDGRLVLAYHVLWELTHVCFEHPGLLAANDRIAEPDDHCTTCSDEGRLGEVIGRDGAATTVRTARGVEHVDTTLVGGVGVGDLVLIHAGAAITVVP